MHVSSTFAAAELVKSCVIVIYFNNRLRTKKSAKLVYLCKHFNMP